MPNDQLNPSPSAWARVKSLFLRATEAEHPSEILGAEPGSAADAVRRMLAAEAAVDGDLQVDQGVSAPNCPRDARWLFSPSTLVASRFEIVQPIGRGGMGEIYEARDRVKDLSVALKVVLPNPSIAPHFAESLLRREFSLAQRVSHRNICRIYDPYMHKPEQGPEMLVISMELLRGKTLAAVLGERGRLPPSEVVEIARQLAAGIDAAHAAGVIHRDLKPSNVIIVEGAGGPRVVITDFGLARQAASQTVTQLSKVVAGTLRYMAPEQIEGRADNRSDLYSFATILFELLTGELPFKGNSDWAISLNRLSVPPRDPATVAPGISLAWRAALLRGLSREPEKRFQSAGDLIDSIDAPASPAMLWPGLLATHARSAPRRVRWTVALTLLCAGGVTASFFRRPSDPFPPFSHVLVANLQHPETKDVALLGAAATLAAAVAQSPHLAAVRPIDLSNTLTKMGKSVDASMDDQTLRQLALRTGQSAVLFGSVSKGRGYSLHLRLERMGSDPKRPAVAAERDFEAANGKELFSAIASASSWVRKLSGEGARELNEQNVRPEDLTTGSWEAFRLLQEARARRLVNDPRGALVFAQEALELDPEFATAESFRADTFAVLRQYKESFDSYRHALQLIKRRNVTGRERYLIEAEYDVDSGEDTASLETYASWSAHFPQDYLPHFYLGYLLFHRGEYPKAISEMQRAVQLDPAQAFVLPHLAAAYLANDQPAQAQHCAVRLRELGENDWAVEVEGLVLMAQHRFEEAAQKVAPLAARSDGVFCSLGPRYVASALADAGRLQAAEQTLLQADTEHYVNSKSRSADRQLEIAFLRWARGDRRGAHASLLAAVDDLDSPESLSLAGVLFARLGDLPSAKHVLSLIGRWPSVHLIVRASARIRAEIALAAHDPGANVILARIAEPVPTALDLECLLHSARAAGNQELVQRLKKKVTERKDILLSWDEHNSGPPGFYWLAACEDDCRPK